MKPSALHVLAASIALLAVALFYVGSHLPDLNDNLSRVSETGEVVSDHVPELVALADRYEPHVTPILEEVAASRALADRALVEAAAYREHLPALLERMAAVETQMTQLQQQLPEVLARVDGALAESRDWRPLGEQGIEEARLWREQIPTYLDRTERLVDQAGEAGRKASEGAVTGIVTGALSLPFMALGNVRNVVDPRSLSARYMTDADWQNLRNAAIALMADPGQRVAQWRTEASGNQGSVRIINTESGDRGLCHTLELTSRFKRDREEVSEHLVCKGADGVWTVVR